MEVRAIIQESVIKTIPKRKKCKMVPKEALKIAVKRGDVKKQRRKGKIYTFESSVPKNSKER